MTQLLGHVFVVTLLVEHTRMCHKSGINVAVTVRVVLVPLDRFLETFLPGLFLDPAQLVQLVTVDGVTQVIELAVWYELDEFGLFFFLAKDLEQRPSHFQVGHFVLAPNIVHMTRSTLVQDDIKRPSHILDKQKVARVATVPVNGQGNVPHQHVGELGNELLWKLVGSVDVVSARNEAGELETAEVGLDQEFRSSLGGGVRVGGFQDVILRHGVGVKVLTFTVDFIRRHVDESTQGLAALGRFQQDVGPVNVGLGKSKGVTERVVHMRLCSKVQDGINLLFPQHVRDQIWRGNVSLDKLEVGELCNLTEVSQACAVVEAIVDNNVVVGILLSEQNGDVGGNEACRWGETPFSQAPVALAL